MIFLIGFMGSGKTTLGRRLAAELGRVFLDTDALIEQRQGRSIQKIFEESGEGFFRAIEQEVLESLPPEPAPVVATGGGLFLGTLQRGWMKRHGRTVWLDARLEDCVRRVGTGAGRPLWMQQNSLNFRAFFEKRRCAYALADLRVDVSAPDVETNLERLLAAVGPGSPGR